MDPLSIDFTDAASRVNAGGILGALTTSTMTVGHVDERWEFMFVLQRPRREVAFDASMKIRWSDRALRLHRGVDAD